MRVDYKEAVGALEDGEYVLAEQKLTYIIESIDRQLTSPSQLAVVYNDRGQARYRQVRFQEAVEDYEVALRLSPDEAVVHYNRSTILYRMGDYLGALPGFYRALQLDKDNTEFEQGYKACKQRVDGE